MKRVRFLGPLITVALATSVLLAIPAQAVVVTDSASGVTAIQSSPSSFSAADAFHWLDPIAPSSGDTARLDASLLNYLTVEVCKVTSAGCLTVQTFTSTGAGSEQLRIVTTSNTGGYYIVNWDTLKAKISLTTSYRIIVSMPGLELGSIELAPPTYKTFGRTWPIKFLLEDSPVIRVRLLREQGKSASQIANVVRQEFGLTQEEVASLLAGDLDPFTEAEIQVALDGVFQDVVIPPTTKIADPSTANVLTAFDPVTGRMSFSTETALLKNLELGDVLVSEPGPNAPYGYLRKVVSIQKDKGAVNLATSPAAITDAVHKGQLNASGELKPAAGSALATPSALKFNDLALTSSADAGDSFDFHKDIDVTIDLATEPGGDVEGTGTVRVQGYVNFNAGYNVGLGIEGCFELPPVCVDRVEAWMGVKQQSHIKMTGDFDGSLHKERTLDTLRFDPIVFMIGPFPVVILPVVNIVLGVDGNAHVDFSFEAGSTAQVKAGAKWTDPDDNGQGWESISEWNVLDDDDFVSADIFGQMFIEAYGKVEAKLLFYGVFGPAVDGSLGAAGFGQTSGRPLWKISGHVNLGVSVGADAAGFFDIGDVYDKDILNTYFDIREAGNLSPVFSNVRTGRIPVELNKAVYLGPRTPGGLQGYYEVRDPEGDTPNLLITEVINGAERPIADTVTFTAPGLRTIKVTATDGEGASSSIFLGIDVRNSVPILTVTPSSGEVAAGEQFFLTATAYDPEDGFLPCSKIDWTATPGATLQESSNPNVCAAVVTFAQQGLGTVTVTATDSLGTPFGQQVGISVGPAPANLKPAIDLNSVRISAFRGPRTAECPLGLGCEVPNNALLSNGEPGSGDYYPPLSMEMTVTDPEGDPFRVTWFCQTGAQAPIIATKVEGGLPSCMPAPISSANEFVRVYATIEIPGDPFGDLAWIVVGSGPEFQFAMLLRTR